MKGTVSTAFQYLYYLGYRAVAELASRLSLSDCNRLGRALGRGAYLFAVPYRRLVRQNLRLAFDDERDESEIRELTGRHFEALGRNTLISLKLSAMTPEEVNAHVSHEGIENLEAAGALGRGIITTISHFGPWELFAQVSTFVNGRDPATMYRAQGNRFINADVVAQRGRLGVKLFDRSTGVFGPLKHLRNGGGLGILIDQHAGDLGIWCPFFGRLSSTTNLPALLSLRTGAPIVSVSIHPDGEDRWKMVYQPPHIPPSPIGDLAKATAELTTALNRELEDAIRQSPEEWFWVHNRWKTPKPHFLINDAKRGINFAEQSAPESIKLKPFRVLLRSPNPLGDACMAIPAVRAIKSGRPDLHLTVLCRENLVSIWKNCPEIDAVISLPKGASPRDGGRLIREQPTFDAAILFPNSLRAALEAWYGKVPRIVGFRGHWRRKLLDQVVPPLPVGPPRHHAHSYLQIAAHVGADTSAESEAVDSTVAAEPRPDRKIGEKLHLGICPGAEYGAAKRWPEERFAQVANRVSESIDCRVSLFGSPNERPIGESLADLITGDDCHNRVGATSLAELVEELKTCDVLVTNDTGTMHLAAMLGVPTVAIFGSTEPFWTRPLGAGHRVVRKHVECSPCFLRECPIDFRCMRELDPERAVEAVLDILKA